jgi:hypothetical protein
VPVICNAGDGIHPLPYGTSTSHHHQLQPFNTGGLANTAEIWAGQGGNAGHLSMPLKETGAVDAQIDWGSFEWLQWLDVGDGADLGVTDSDRDHLYVHRVSYRISRFNVRGMREASKYTLTSQSNTLFYPSPYLWL